MAPWLPVPADFGGALRTYNLIREIARHHEVTLLAPARADEIPHALALGNICNVTTVPARWTPRHSAGFTKRVTQLRSIGSRRSFLELSTTSEQLQRVLDRLFLTTTVDLVLYESTRMALHRPPVPCPTIVDAHDVEANLLRRVARSAGSDLERTLKLAEARKVERLEATLWSNADLVVATSENDATAIETASGVPAMVVPNGVDVGTFTPPNDWPARRDIVFTGVMRHQPNSDAARWYLDEIHPLVEQRAPDSRVVFAGADPPDWLRNRASKHVLVTGRVDDIRPWLWSAAVAIVPLRSGGGTRLKIFEAFAAGVPVVATSLGAEGIGGIEGSTILADDPASFAEAVVTVLDDAEVAARLRDNATRLVADYDWSTIATRLDRAFDEATQRFASRNAVGDVTTMDWSGRLWRKG